MKIYQKMSELRNSNILNVDFYRRFDDLINQLGGITKVARMIGVSRHAVIKWRDGENRIPLTAAISLCREANVSLDWLAGYSPIKEEDEEGEKREVLDKKVMRIVIETLTDEFAKDDLMPKGFEWYEMYEIMYDPIIARFPDGKDTEAIKAAILEYYNLVRKSPLPKK